MDVEMANLDSFGDHRKVSGRLQELKSQQDKKGIEVMRINSQLRFGDRARESLYDAILPDGIYKGSGIGTKLAMSGDLFGGKRQAPLALSGGKQYFDRIVFSLLGFLVSIVGSVIVMLSTARTIEGAT